MDQPSMEEAEAPPTAPATASATAPFTNLLPDLEYALRSIRAKAFILCNNISNACDVLNIQRGYNSKDDIFTIKVPYDLYLEFEQVASKAIEAVAFLSLAKSSPVIVSFTRAIAALVLLTAIVLGLEMSETERRMLERLAEEHKRETETEKVEEVRTEVQTKKTEKAGQRELAREEDEEETSAPGGKVASGE